MNFLLPDRFIQFLNTSEYPSEEFWSRILVRRAIAFVIFTRWIGFFMSELFRKIDFSGFMSWKTTQMPCVRWSALNRSSLQLMTGVTIDIGSPRSLVTCHSWQQVAIRFRANHSSSTWLLIIPLGPFRRLFIKLTMRMRALFSKSASTFESCRTSILEGATFQNESMHIPFT